MEVHGLRSFKVEAVDIEISQITQREYNVHEINRIKEEYGALRQKSKAPS